MAFSWAERYAERVGCFQGSAIREMLHWAQLPGMISLSGGMPAPELFPVEAFRRFANQVLDETPGQALQYGITEGFVPLREWIVEHLGRKGMSVSTDGVLVTNGSQQAVDLISKVLLNPGDVVAVERPSFIGALQAFESYQARFLSVNTDDEGLIVDDLRRLLAGGHQVKMVYAQPNFQNPSGVSMSAPRRQQLAQLALEQGLVILEDDPYAELIYEGDPVPPIKTYGASDQTLYLGTVSKIVAPGIRIGWVAGAPELVAKLALGKQCTDLHTDMFLQRIVNLYLRGGELPGHIATLQAAYRERRDAMLAAIAEHFPSEVRCTRPRGGLFVWAQLPEGVNTLDFIQEAVDQRVMFIGGAGFYRDGSGQNSMRLNFSNAQPDTIREGIARLGAVLKRHLATP
ncbi:MAG TPA: PLP-dependent aminotransferase family protein [Chloroflexota bacterium]|nr:PLP-dependent aminotransferase family protein [Chloroflexota bacterium]